MVPKDRCKGQKMMTFKKTHSVKSNLLTLPDRKITWLSRIYYGHTHDKKICDQQPLKLPKGTRLWQDTGFIGHCPDSVDIQMPAKKPKGRELTGEQKERNKEISKFRILVEHAISGVKRCRIVKDRLRCYKFQFDDLKMELACGLHNLRIDLKTNALLI